MNKIVLIIVVLLTTISCDSDDSRTSNPNLIPPSFNIEVNLDLPQFNSLKFPGNSEIITTQGVGVKGIVIYNVDNTQYTAFELSDPNIAVSSCSALEINGLNAESNCGNDNVYNIVTGQQTEGEGGYPLLRYRINRQGNILFVSN